ncbi:DUF167 domain-containing protein [Methanolobus mangrovi]|uniref:UPF0235 protein RE476_12605 n=1 Tax=Methanolobus mangrovi TaxID=3072977 RepID=A0AA51UFV0_9EURY|nr:DUF167 domain-containing protein [Methanolobus mangrovi]WMW22193.1 DUF167 domain-containing protein [Methanolobus mangrovi]
MSFEDALKKVDAGVIIDIEVTPGSKKLCIPSGYNLWRKRVEVRLSQSAQKGKANEQLISSLAELFQLRSTDVSIVNGMHNSKKSLLLENVEYDTVVRILKDRLPEHAD